LSKSSCKLILETLLEIEKPAKVGGLSAISERSNTRESGRLSCYRSMVMVVRMRVMKHESSVYRSRHLESRSKSSPAGAADAFQCSRYQ
jgi:hypothetical protein